MQTFALKIRSIRMQSNANLVRFQYMLLGLLVCFNIYQSKAQTADPDYTAYDLIQDLSKGQVLVRLKSHHNKLEALNRELEKSGSDADYRKRVEKEMEAIIRDRDSFNLNLMKAMKEHFVFCKSYFYYDRDHQLLKSKGYRAPLYLDSLLHPISEPEFAGDKFVIIAQGKTKGQEMEAFLFLDSTGVQLPRPFPGHLRLYAFRPVVNALVSEDYYRENAVWYANHLNEKFEDLYEKALVKNFKRKKK